MVVYFICGFMKDILKSPEIFKSMFPEGAILNNQYQIKKVLGEGAFGVVYLTEDTYEPGTRRAIKEFVRDSIPPGKEELLIRETKFLSELSHPGLPKLIDQFFYSDNFYMVMDFIEGNSLDSIFNSREKVYTEEEILYIFYHLCSIFEYLHGQKPAIIYRDLKPSNIIITSLNEIKLIDFGTARFFSPGKTKDTFVMGTPGFASPEQYGIGQSDTRSDIYTLGATIYYLLTRKNMETAKFKFPPIKTLNPAVSSEIEDILKKSLQLDPNDRFQNVNEIKSRLISKFGDNIKNTQITQKVKIVKVENNQKTDFLVSEKESAFNKFIGFFSRFFHP